MSAPKEKIQTRAGDEVEVLYQKMGDRWFAFSLIEDEVFVGSLTPEELAQMGGPEVETDAAKILNAKKRQKLIREAGNS
jgi:hypothetical protein